MELQLLEGDEQTVALDFIDPTGAANPWGVSCDVQDDGFDIGEVTPELVAHVAGRRGKIVHRRDTPLLPFGFDLALEAPTIDALNGFLGDVSRLLRDPPGPLKYQETGAATHRYIDVEGATLLPQALRGQERGVHLTFEQLVAFDTPIRLLRQPTLRGPELRAYVNNVPNGTLLFHSGPPDSALYRPSGWQGFINYPLLEWIDPEELAYEYSVIASGASTGLQIATNPPRAVPGEIWMWSLDHRIVSASGALGFHQLLMTFVNEAQSSNTGELYGPATTLTTWRRDWEFMRAPAGTGFLYPRFYGADSADSSPGSLRVKVRRAQLEVWHTARDSFNRPNSPSLYGLGRLESGQLWVPYAGSQMVSGNEAVATGLDVLGRSLSMVELPTADGEIVVRMHTNSVLVFHGRDAENYLQLRFDIPGSGITIDRRVNGVNTWTSQFGSIPGLTAGYKAIRVRMNSTNIRVYVDETLRIDWNMGAADAARFATAKLVGPLLTNLTDSRMDSFNFAPLTDPTGPSPFRVGEHVMPVDPETPEGRIVVGFIEGDAPTPVKVKARSTASFGDKRLLVAAYADPHPEQLHLIDYVNFRKRLRAEESSLGTDTALDSDALASGFGQNVARTTFATQAGLVGRLTINNAVGFPTVRGMLLDVFKGRRWRLYARVRAESAGSDYTFAVISSFGAGSFTHPTVTRLNLATTFRDVPLADFEATDEFTGVGLTMMAGRTAGASALRWDLLALVPLDTAVGRVYANLTGDGLLGTVDDAFQTDPEEGLTYHTRADESLSIGKHEGPVPVWLPPGPFALYLLPSKVGTGDDEQSIQGESMPVSLAYSPRWYS
jgi:hypothetical protein